MKIAELSDYARPYVDVIVSHILPQARRRGATWHVGSTGGESGNSLYVLRGGLRCGHWTDAATGDHGDLVDLWAAARGVSLATAKMEMESFLGVGAVSNRPGPFAPPVPPPHLPRPGVEAEEEDDADRDRRLALARKVVDRSVPIPGTLGELYFRARLGLAFRPLPRTLKFASRLWHAETEQWFPGVVAPMVRWGRDDLAGVHRTFLDRSGTRKAAVGNAKLTLGPVSGAAVRLAPLGPNLLVGEGIESTLAAMALSGLPGWAAGSTSLMRSLVLPPVDVVPSVTIAADRDLNGAGEAAAECLAERLAREGRTVRIALPPGDGKADWLDIAVADGAPAEPRAQSRAVV